MEVIEQAQGGQLRLVRTPHPLTTHGQTSLALILNEQETLATLLERHEVDETWIVEVGGLQVPHLMWSRTRVKHGQIIECRRAAQKDVVRLVAFAALAYFTMGAGAAWISTSFGVAAGSFAAHMIGAAVFMAGAMVINRVLPPPVAGRMDMASNTVEPTYSLSGGRNSQRLWQPMALVLGQPYAVFDLASQPYTYFAGEEQYLTQVFHLGINCHRVSTLRIGQTDLVDYSDVALSARGLSGNTYSTALPSTNVDSIVGALLDAPASPGAWVTRTSSLATRRLAVDLEATVYSVDTSNGAWVRRDLDLDIQYAVANSGNWVNMPTGTFRVDSTGAREYAPAGKAWISGTSSKPVRLSIQLDVASGQYDVRIRKVSVNESSTSGGNQVTWTQLRSFQTDPTSYPGQALLAVNIKASGQLNGAIDEFNGILTAKPMPHWNGSAWVTATDRTNGLSNPGTILLAYLRGFYDENGRLLAGLGWPDSRIDIEGIKRFTVWCTAKSFSFDAYVQDPLSHEELIDAITYAGLGTRAWVDGRLGVQWLDPDQPVEGVINMGNIKAQSFSVQYDTNDRADEIEYGYFDRSQGNSWNALRVLAPGVSMPRSTARLSNLGITSEGHAATLARHAMAQNLYMAKAITFEQDLEHLTYGRGTVLALSHDMTQWGYGGRLRGVSVAAGVVTLDLDDSVPASGPGGASSRYIGLRLLGESQYRIFTVQAFVGTARSVTLVGAWPSGVPLPGTSGQVHDALWIYDFRATPGQKVVVSSIEPGDSQSGARVTVVPLPDEFWPYVWTGAYTPPPNRSLLSNRTKVTAASVKEVLKRQGNTFYTELTVQFDTDGTPDTVQVWGSSSGGILQLLGTTMDRSFTWMGGLSETWSIELRPFKGAFPGTSYALTHSVQGLSLPPPNVPSFTISGNVLTWTPVSAIDLAGYKIRFHYGANTWWPTAADLHDGLITESPYTLVNRPAGPATLLIKAVDTTGNESTVAATIITDLGDPLVDNIINSWPQHPTWPGTKTNCAVVGGVLQATAIDSFYGADNQPFYGSETGTFYQLTQSAALVYEFSMLADGSGRLTLSHSITAASYTIEYQRDSAAAFYGSDGDYFYEADASLFYGTPEPWAVWPGELQAIHREEMRFRVSTQGGTGVESINTLSANLDVPDVNLTFSDLAVSAMGTRLSVPTGLVAIKNVQITIQADGNGGVTARYSDKQNLTLGPLITVLDSSGTAVPGLIDAVVQAY